MSIDEYEKLRRLIRFLIILLVIFILLSGAALIHSFINPGRTSFPTIIEKGDKGDPAQIDYEKVSTIIEGQIEKIDYSKLEQIIEDKVTKKLTTIPPAKDGTNGNNGLDGYTPIKGIDYFDGENGINGKTPELRINPLTGDIEWRYIGDRLWNVLLENCSIKNCGVLP